MAWEHFDENRELCKLQHVATGEVIEGSYNKSIVTTGKSRVFNGYRIVVYFLDVAIEGRDTNYSESYTKALKDCNKKLEAEGWRLLVAGNAPGYYETGLSCGRGQGYIKGQKGPAVDIMSFYQA